MIVAVWAIPLVTQRDRLGIPHIYATNSHDLFLVQGYTHAQDRFWQMDDCQLMKEFYKLKPYKYQRMSLLSALRSDI
jgi:Penicillin amidase